MYAAVLSIIITYVVLGGLGVISSLSKDQVDDIMGYIAVGVSLLLYSSPFFKIKDVLKYKTGIFIPIRMAIVHLHAYGQALVPPRDQRLLCLDRRHAAHGVHDLPPEQAPAGPRRHARGPAQEGDGGQQWHAVDFDRPHERAVGSKAVPQSPMYQFIQSPLAQAGEQRRETWTSA
ncbi:hypothetical protein PF005_g19080 [Phytophthora fragariae]|uniref:Uncharacterized protein n=1 Tax=Phytophthora fragariae TaxID=53985 RepID=A0A6A3RBF0_9STRA|nr:hypothetical protein PF003_g2765 [Phytophthora fragariae]KAE8931366.1 hypothetical protein PF009_g18574 [Phytophthora fragariae]KAE9092895.1 hypothetical protein PF007_g18314 [Phytophthora fragariae]KAE9120705.1 hypothetical protein PF006_g18065 [Phytophthora fragariae]KAE9190865.1 hypothetical protein PF005_g19080 [Phytophthora fragariae]